MDSPVMGAYGVFKCHDEDKGSMQVIDIPTSTYSGLAASTSELFLGTARMSDCSNNSLSYEPKRSFTAQQENEVKKQNKRAQKLENRNRRK